MMIGGLCHDGLFDEASDLFAEMEDNDCSLEAVTHNTLICSSDNKYSAGVHVDQMRSRDFSADALTTYWTCSNRKMPRTVAL